MEKTFLQNPFFFFILFDIWIDLIFLMKTFKKKEYHLNNFWNGFSLCFVVFLVDNLKRQPTDNCAFLEAINWQIFLFVCDLQSKPDECI